MKKLLLLSMMALVGLSVSAQFKSKSSVAPQAKQEVVKASQSQRSFQAVAPRQDMKMSAYAPTNKLTLDPAKLQPVARAKHASSLPVLQSQFKPFSKGKMQSRNMVNFQPTMTLNPQASSRAKAARKAPAFAESYTGMGVDYGTREPVQWTMRPSVATFTNSETGEEEDHEVFVDVIPVPSIYGELFPNGIPVKYTVEEENRIVIEPQAVASFQNEAKDTTFYITIFSANSDDEDGTIHLEIDENGKLSFIDGNQILYGEFANVEFDPDMGDSEAFLGYDELIAGVRYYYRIETRIDEEYKAHGTNAFSEEEDKSVSWIMQRGTTAMDDDETHFFVNMTPMVDMFANLYPDGIDVEYEQEGSTITVKPQVIASYEDDEEGTVYVMLFSGTSDDGSIVLTEEEYGLATIKDESIVLGAWSTEEFDPTFESYLGGYVYMENVKYRLADAPIEAPSDVSCEPEELVLFAGLGLSGYGYNDNLAIIGAYAPTHFHNNTMDIATGFEWSVTEYNDEDNETTITGNKRNFSLYAKGGCVYENLSLVGINETVASEPFVWGTGQTLTDEGAARYENLRAYAGRGASFFSYGDGTYATMTRQNPDGDLTFYTNWATPDLYERTSMSTIYSYQGKPSAPLFLTGVTLPLLKFEAKEDFNLHIKIYKCQRSSSGRITLGDIIAEGDATTDNVNAEYDAGLTAVEFTELYVEDEFGMSETVDYLFIEDEFIIAIEGWDNGTFSGVLGSQGIDVSKVPSTYFTQTGEEEGRLHYYTSWFPQLFIGLIDATYGYLYTEDDTDLLFAKDGGSSSIHVDPMYYNKDEETEEPTYSLELESIIVDGDEAEELPEWLTVEVANEDYTTATATDEEGEEYEYFVNGIDYDLVFNVEALPEGIENRSCKIVFFQTGARLTVTVTQDIDPDGIHTVVEKTPVKNSRAYNVAGQQVGKNYKGIVVKNGKKALVK